MKILKKLRQLIKSKSQKSTPQTTEPVIVPEAVSDNDSEDDYLHPITSRIMQWLDKHQWKYEHQKPKADKRVHHLVLGFAMHENDRDDWLCVIRVNESNQLITMFGISEDSVPEKYYAPVLVAIAKANINIGYGNLELDIDDGEFRAKISLDAEFTKLTDKSLECYIQAVSNLMSVIDDINKTIKQDDLPISFNALIEQNKKRNQNNQDDDEEDGFFMPTRQAQ